MTKENKVVAIQEIKDLLQDAKVVYVADLEGLNAGNSSDFRRPAFKNNIKVKAVSYTHLCKQFNGRTQYKPGQVLPVLITV